MPRHRRLATIALATALLAGCTSGGAADASADAVAGAVLDEAGTARLEGTDVVVDLGNGPIRLTPSDDTTFFVCQDDDCEVVDAAAFRTAVRDGDDIRVLGPNAELLSPEAERLPRQLWVVLDQR